MLLRVLAVGRRMPAWVEAGVKEYCGRLPGELRLEFVDIAPGQRSRGADPARAIAEEGARMLARIPDGAKVVALDERGKSWSTRELAHRIAEWRDSAVPVVLLVGGPEGLAPACRARAQETWSLSALTLPHALVRVVLAEQVYRAWTVLAGHPYHRD